MSHIAFLNIPGHGHVNPTLPVVTELVARGHRVTYAVPEDFAEAVAHAGATPVVHPTTLPTAAQEWPTDLAPAMRLFLHEARQLLPLLAAAYRADRPDLVVYDIGAWPARVLAERWGVRAIQFSPTFVAYEGWEEDMGGIFDTPEAAAVYREIDAWLRSEGCAIDARTYVGHPDRAVVGIPRSFQYNSDSVDGKYTFVGPCIGDRSFQGTWRPPQGERRILLVSLGSAYTDDPEFYRNCLEAFGDRDDWYVVLNIGKKVDEADLGEIPDNAEVHHWIPQLEILSHATAFITHCGMGGTMEGLHHGVPMVGVPTLGEQTMNALRLEELGAGRHLPRSRATPEALFEAVEALITDPGTAAALARMKHEIADAGGTRKAADVIEASL